MPYLYVPPRYSPEDGLIWASVSTNCLATGYVNGEIPSARVQSGPSVAPRPSEAKPLTGFSQCALCSTDKTHQTDAAHQNFGESTSGLTAGKKREQREQRGSFESVECAQSESRNIVESLLIGKTEGLDSRDTEWRPT